MQQMDERGKDEPWNIPELLIAARSKSTLPHSDAGRRRMEESSLISTFGLDRPSATSSKLSLTRELTSYMSFLCIFELIKIS